MKCLRASTLFLLQLAYPTLSYVACGQKTPQHRFSPFRSLRLTATNNDELDTNSAGAVDNANMLKSNNASADNPNLFERTVRRVTRNKSYKFGDLAKSAAEVSTKTFEGAVRTVTQDENYRFGDYSKKVVSTGTGELILHLVIK